MATTGARITLEFDIDDQPMGAVIEVTRPPRDLRVRVLGTDALASVVVVRNNEDWHTVTDPGCQCSFTLQDLGMPEELTDWYYVRVAQQDGNIAWSSPIWIVDAR